MQYIEQILEVFHHPAIARGRTLIQAEMRSVIIQWVTSLGDRESVVLEGLSFDGKICFESLQDVREAKERQACAMGNTIGRYYQTPAQGPQAALTMSC